jgi:hypothetical protein
MIIPYARHEKEKEYLQMIQSAQAGAFIKDATSNANSEVRNDRGSWR